MVLWTLLARQDYAAVSKKFEILSFSLVLPGFCAILQSVSVCGPAIPAYGSLDPVSKKFEF
jgi:hypothetical protein